MKIAIGADHGGVELKAEVEKYLESQGHEYRDFGAFSTAAVDYPDIAIQVAEAVKNGEADRGILICGTGIGMSIAANKVPGIRCALLSDVYSAKCTRDHNDANVMAMGARVIGPGLALEIVDAYLNKDFSNGERHVNRLKKIAEIEKKYNK
ncbi:MAG: ribose 5-phosphate isomerase B [Clostridiales bacterium]|nr:ribose 5-phosphate isomerase B [Clostridiales bacterium]